MYDYVDSEMKPFTMAQWAKMAKYFFFVLWRAENLGTLPEEICQPAL